MRWKLIDPSEFGVAAVSKDDKFLSFLGFACKLVHLSYPVSNDSLEQKNCLKFRPADQRWRRWLVQGAGRHWSSSTQPLLLTAVWCRTGLQHEAYLPCGGCRLAEIETNQPLGTAAVINFMSWISNIVHLQIFIFSRKVFSYISVMKVLYFFPK